MTYLTTVLKVLKNPASVFYETGTLGPTCGRTDRITYLFLFANVRISLLIIIILKKQSRSHLI